MSDIRESKYKKIKEVFAQNNEVVRTREIADKVHPRYLYQLVEQGVVEKIKRGLYAWNNDYSTAQELLTVKKSIPNGVLCLLSALSLHELTTVNPWEYYIAIHRDDHKPALPEYPPIQIFYFSQKQFEVGIEELEVAGDKVKIYDLEKTICDCIRYRNKIGQDVVKEAMDEYLKKRDYNIEKLLHYAEVTRAVTLIKKYLEVLI